MTDDAQKVQRLTLMVGEHHHTRHGVGLLDVYFRICAPEAWPDEISEGTWAPLPLTVALGGVCPRRFERIEVRGRVIQVIGIDVTDMGDLSSIRHELAGAVHRSMPDHIQVAFIT